MPLNKELRDAYKTIQRLHQKQDQDRYYFLGLFSEIVHDFNTIHPELRSKERFFTNTLRDKCSDFQERYKELTSLRQGETAYDIHGRELPSHAPWFVDREEYAAYVEEHL